MFYTHKPYRSVSGSSGVSGTEVHSVKRMRMWPYIGVIKQTTTQVWSPALTEIRTERGLVFGPYILTLSRWRKHWTDGKQPEWEPASSCFLQRGTYSCYEEGGSLLGTVEATSLFDAVQKADKFGKNICSRVCITDRKRG